MARDRSNYQRGGKGGARSGQPGKTYSNRSDLQQGPRTQPARAATGQQYGQAKAQLDAQRAVPLPQAAPLVPLDAPSQRPNEPPTAGMPTGAGPGPEALPIPTAAQLSPIDQIRAMYAADPSDDLRDLLAYLTEQPAAPSGGMRFNPNMRLDGSQVIDRRPRENMPGSMAQMRAGLNPSDAGGGVVNPPRSGDDINLGA